MASKDLGLVKKEIEHFETVLAQSMRQIIEHARQRLSLVSPRSMESMLIRRHMLLMQRFDTATEAIERGMRSKVDASSHRIALAASAIEISNPKAIMKRGFSIVRKSAEIIRSAETIKPGEKVHISFYRGEANASILSAQAEDARSNNDEGL
jgi:exodeoxyribonuclease VII large subunit